MSPSSQETLTPIRVPGIAVFHRIGEQVVHHLRDSIGVRVGLRHLALEAQVEGAVGGMELDALDGSPRERRHVDALAHELEAAGFEAREIHQIADHAVQARGRGEDPVDVLEEIRVVGRAREQLRIDRDRTERLP